MPILGIETSVTRSNDGEVLTTTIGRTLETTASRSLMSILPRSPGSPKVIYDLAMEVPPAEGEAVLPPGTTTSVTGSNGPSVAGVRIPEVRTPSNRLETAPASPRTSSPAGSDLRELAATPPEEATLSIARVQADG